MDSGAIVAVALVGVVLALAAVFFRRVTARALQTRRERADARNRAMVAHGFSAVEDVAFADRLKMHFEHNPPPPWITSCARKPGTDHAVWSCEVRWPSEIWDDAIVVVSEHLALPRFQLFPAVRDATGASHASLDRLLHELAQRDTHAVTSPPIALTGTDYMLSGPSIAWTEPRFTPAFREWLCRVKGLALSGEGAMLVVWPAWQTSLSWGPPLEPDFDARVRMAETCFAYLRT